MKIAAGYIRVSTEDQVEYSPESQRKALIDYAKCNDMVLPEEFLFSDEGISGRSTKRPGFQRMIGTAKTKPKPFDVILVWKFSRFARNREDSIVYKSMLRKQCGIEVVSISEQLGEDKTSILIEALLEAMDEYYSINLAEEVTRGMSEKARQGGTLGKLAYGYRSEQGRVFVDEARAEIVRSIFRDFDAGMPMKQIAWKLNDAGYRTARGNLWDNRGVEYILRNIFYTGHTHWTPEKVRGKHAETITDKTIITGQTHEAIITEELFERCQKRIAELKRTHIYKEHPTHGSIYPLKGLVRCSDCGATLAQSNRGGLQCHRYTTGKCKVSHYIGIEKLNRLVLAKLEEDFATGHFRASIRREPEEIPPENLQLQKELHRLQAQLERVKEAYAAGVDTLAEYRENKSRLQSRMQSIQERMKPVDVTSDEELEEKTKSAIASGIETLKGDSPDDFKNGLLKTFIHTVTFDRKNEKVEISYRI